MHSISRKVCLVFAAVIAMLVHLQGAPRLLARTTVNSATQPKQRHQLREFTNWPVGKSPQEIGRRVAERFVSGPFWNFVPTRPPEHITYPETCTWYGALTFAELAGDQDLMSRLIKRFDPLLGERFDLVPPPTHVDLSVFGAVPLELYIDTGDQRYLDLGRSIADRQWSDPTPEALTSQSRFWIDDMYMITAVQVQAYRATGDHKYLDRAALEMTAYLDKLQQPNGLFFHAPDAPFYWGRGNGWVAAGMAELLRSLPKDHRLQSRILRAYRQMMKSLLGYQDKDGMWHQLIDHPEAWPETSSTAMFTFALITGLKNGWLARKAYAPAARKAWLGLVSYINPDGDISNVCEGTGKKNDLNYYLDRARHTGDLHGQAPILWSASAFLR